MWFLFALVTFFAWGGADLYYKKGNDPADSCSHLKTAMIVGLVMGLAALYTLLTGRLHYQIINLLIYLPVSLCYILSMVVGYYGLRYLELSIASPVQNASGAVTALLLMIFLKTLPGFWTVVSIVLITAGVVFLGILERNEERKKTLPNEKRYERGLPAILIPLTYCVIDSLGTFFDGLYLDDFSCSPLRGVTEETLEDTANVSYQLTFFLAALLLLAYLVIIKKERLKISGQKNRFIAAVMETAGQMTYVYALSGNSVAAAPLVGSYCVASLLLGRLSLGEHLTKKQYGAIALVILGIIILGFVEAGEG